MTIWIVQNLTEKGRQSVRSGSKVVYTMRLQQTKTYPDKSPPGDLQAAPTTRFPKANNAKGQGKANKTCQAGWKRDHSSCCH